MRWVLLVVVVLAVLIVVATGERAPPSPAEKARLDARAAIAACWQNYERKSIDPANKHIVAGACEQLEQKYRARYGSAP